MSLLVAVAALAIWAVRFDYGWGYGDQDEFVPYLMHLLDKRLFASDWFVATQLGNIGVRTYFVWLLRLSSFVLTPGMAVACTFVISWLAIALAIDRLTHQLGGGSIASVLAIVGALCLTPKWTLGGNDLVYTMLVPEMVAWALALPALVLFLRNRVVAAGVILGIAAWFQLLVGVLTSLVLTFALFAANPNRTGLRRGVVLGSMAALFAAPILIPIAVQQLGPVTSDGGTTSTLLILTHFRAPHHYLPSHFPTASWLRVAALLIPAVAGALLLRKSRLFEQIRPAAHLLVVIAILCLVSWGFTEVTTYSPVVKLQVFKTTVLAKLLLVILISIALEVLITSYGPLPKRALTPVITGLSILVLGVVAVIAALGSSHFRDFGEAPLSVRAPGPENWARAHSAVDAVFSVPPSNSSFRTYARRSIVVNYAAVPFRPDDMIEWYDRLRAIAPISTAVGRAPVPPRLDRAYAETTAEDWLRLADRYGIDYLVRRRRVGSDLPFDVVYRDSSWVTYRVPVSRSGVGE